MPTKKIEDTLKATGRYQIDLLNGNKLTLIFDGFMFYGVSEIKGHTNRTKTHPLSRENILKVLKYMGLNRYGNTYILSTRYTIMSV